MADSNITKRALATSLKELMVEQPFEKINVAQICERCNMNRKSFYYHFKDKYYRGRYRPALQNEPEYLLLSLQG